MRIIDADVLIEKAYIPNTQILKGWWHKETLEDVKNAPTICVRMSDDEVIMPCIENPCGMDCIEVEPVRHGRWIGRRSLQVDEDDFEIAKCSECGEEVILYQWQDLFCPNCGAIMEK